MNSCPVFLTAFLVTLASTPLLRLLAFKLQILDFPGARKIHKTATPLLGGVAIYLGLLSGLFIGWKSFSFLCPLIISATIILIIGFINDTIGLSAQFRLLCQVLVSLILISFGIRISFLPPTLWGNILEVIITIIWIVGVTNAYNYLDGLDGLAAGSAVVNAVCFAVILYSTGQYPLGELAIILALASLAFLPFNFSSKKMFLGDAGSTFLGFFLACLALVGSWAEDNIVKISIPFLILGVPIFDMIFTTIMRIKEEKVKTVIEWLRYGGKDHFHHYLVDIGLRPIGAVIFIYFITLSLGISAVMVSNDKALEAFLTLSQAAIIFGVIATLIVVGKRRRSGWSKT